VPVVTYVTVGPLWTRQWKFRFHKCGEILDYRSDWQFLDILVYVYLWVSHTVNRFSSNLLTICQVIANVKVSLQEAEWNVWYYNSFAVVTSCTCIVQGRFHSRHVKPQRIWALKKWNYYIKFDITSRKQTAQNISPTPRYIYCTDSGGKPGIWSPPGFLENVNI
jgi:hypothetical protein